jgi:cyclophilin family peptidyl-prolyl cis-trans isomerase
MARNSDPGSATTQFFICIGTQSFLDGQYTVFGHVIQGQSAVEAISRVRRDAHDAPVADERVERAFLAPHP